MSTANGRRGAKIHLDRERRIRYTLAAMEEIQDKYDVDLVAGDPFDFGSLEDVAWLVCLGLRHAGETYDADLPWWERLLVHFGIREAPEITEAWVKGQVDLQNVYEVTDALSQATGSGREDPEDTEGADPANPTQAAMRQSR